MLGGELHVARSGVKASAFAVGAHVFYEVFNFGLGKTLLAAFVVVVSNRVVKHFALVFSELHTSAHAFWAPAVFAVVTEQTRI